MEGGGFAAARPSIVRKEIGGALAWNRGHLPFKCTMWLRPYWLVQGCILKFKNQIISFSADNHTFRDDVLLSRNFDYRNLQSMNIFRNNITTLRAIAHVYITECDLQHMPSGSHLSKTWSHNWLVCKQIYRPGLFWSYFFNSFKTCAELQNLGKELCQSARKGTIWICCGLFLYIKCIIWPTVKKRTVGSKLILICCPTAKELLSV